MRIETQRVVFGLKKKAFISAGHELNLCLKGRLDSQLESCTMAQAVSRRPLTAEVRVHSQASLFMVDKAALGRDFLRALRFPPVRIIPTMLHSYLHLHVSFNQKDKPGNLPKPRAQRVGWKSSAAFSSQVFEFGKPESFPAIVFRRLRNSRFLHALCLHLSGDSVTVRNV